MLCHVLRAVQQPQLAGAELHAVLVAAAAGSQDALKLSVVIRMPAAWQPVGVWVHGFAREAAT